MYMNELLCNMFKTIVNKKKLEYCPRKIYCAKYRLMYHLELWNPSAQFDGLTKFPMHSEECLPTKLHMN